MSEETTMSQEQVVEADTGQEKTTYTKEEVEDLLQRETDRRVSSALKKAERKNQEKVKEASKLAQMDAQQRYAYELEQREKAIAEKERELLLSENKAAAMQALSERSLSPALADFVLTEDGEEMFARIRKLEDSFKASVKEEVEKRLSSSTPKKNLPMDTNIGKEDFAKLPLSAQAKIAREQPELYQRLTKR